MKIESSRVCGSSLLERLAVCVEDVSVEDEPDGAVVRHVAGEVDALEPAQLVRQPRLHLPLRVVQVLDLDLHRPGKD